MKGRRGGREGESESGTDNEGTTGAPLLIFFLLFFLCSRQVVVVGGTSGSGPF